MGCTASSNSRNNKLASPLATSRHAMSKHSMVGLSSDLKFKYVIVGFGVAGGEAASELARLGVGEFDVALVGEEPSFAYERPVLSKAYMFPPNVPNKPPARLPGFSLKGQGEDQVVHDEDWYQQRNWTCYLSTRCVAVDYKNKTLKLVSNQTGLEERISYDKLIVATGSRPVRLKAQGLDQVKHGVYHVYTEEDFSLLVRKLERVTGKRFVNRKLMAQKKGGKSTGVLQSTRKLDDVEKRSQVLLLQQQQQGEEDDDTAPAATAQSRAVVLGGGALGVELACALSGWGLDEIVLVTQSAQLFPQQTRWSAAFHARVQTEVLKRCKLRLVFEDTVARVVGMDASGQPSPLRAVVLGSVPQDELPCEVLVVAIGTSPVRDLLPSGATMGGGGSGKKQQHPLVCGGGVKDVWLAGELAQPQCGVERSRTLGRSAARLAFSATPTTTPSSDGGDDSVFASSTLFDFSDNPLVWYEMGRFPSAAGEGEEVVLESETHMACLYFDGQGSGAVLRACVALGNSHKFLQQVRTALNKGAVTRAEVERWFASI